MSADQTKNRQIWVNIFFALVAAITVIDGVLIAKKSHDWIVSDWLINYEGGFVRRGLPGEAALLLSRMTHLRPEVFVVIFYLGCFLVFLASMRKLVLASSLNFWVILSVISPATFSFQILHVEGGYRKEILFLASLSLLAWVLLRRNIRKATLILAMTIGAGCGVLSHELILFYLPYIAGLLLLSGRSPKQMAVIFSAPLVLAFLLTWICSHHTGNAKIASGICDSLGYRYPMPATSDICAGGPIGFLAVTPAQALQDARRVILGEHYLFYFSIFALLAALPLLGEGYFLLVRGRRREVQIIAISALASFVGSIVLFVYGVDWGRWIYIHIVSLTILMLFMDARTVQDGTSFSAGTALPTWPRSGLAAILVCYSLCWSLPAVVTKEPIRMGYMGRIHEVLSSRLSR